MNKSITQATQNDKQISKSIKRFFTRCYCSLVPRSSNGFCRCFAFQIGKICYHHCIIRHFQFRKCLPVNSNYKVSYFLSLESCLNLSRECNSLSYDAMTAHTAVVFTRYMMLSLESRESNDNRSLGELFLYFSDEMSDITWIQAFQMLLQMFRTMLSDNTELSDEKINELANAFMDALPTMMKIRLQAA